jgi:hypothetical protein
MVNKTAFDSFTPESSYWLGFLMADGCNTGLRIDIGLASVDIQHLYKFRMFMNSDAPIRRVGTSAHISINSIDLCDRLTSIGVTPRKSYTAKVSERARSLLNSRDFWRGVIDGDGSIGCWLHNGKKNGASVRMDLTGSKSLLEQFRCFVVKACPEYEGNTHPSKGVYCIKLWGATALKMIRTLYGSTIVSLDRKQLLADGLLRDWEVAS